MYLLLTLAVVGALLVLNELWVRRLSTPNEFSRKFIHIVVGSFVALWPFYLSWRDILILSAGFIIVTLVSKQLNIFRAIHSVQRPTYGELFFAIAVGATALITHSKGIYAAALLQMSLADGLAAIVGLRYGKNNRYHLLGATKSVAGTATFFVVSISLLIAFNALSVVYVPIVTIVGLAATATLLENLGAYGLDNLLVPLVIALVLRA